MPLKVLNVETVYHSSPIIFVPYTNLLSVRFVAILKRLIRKLERFLLTSAGAVIFSPHAMFRILSVTCLLTRIKALRLIIFHVSACASC